MKNDSNQSIKNHSQRKQQPAYIEKTKLSNEDLPHFQWELVTLGDEAERLLLDYPMSGARTKINEETRLAALSVILANMKNGNDLIIPNFAETRVELNGFSRTTFLNVLDHLQKVALIGREGEKFKRSIITYSTRIRKYLPIRRVCKPLMPVRINLKDKNIPMAKLNKDVRSDQNRRMRDVWDFYLDHEISPGIDNELFNLVNDVEIEVEKKPPLQRPDSNKILPYIVFNDRDLTKGGRMYGAFWIGMKSILRRKITIDSELTSDIDGKGMHVQLLYRDRGISMPTGDPYLFANPKKRAVAKGLMLLMMNTKNEMNPIKGRQAVEKTYRKHFGKEEGLDEVILELESFHNQIFDDLYKPNWGRLQKTEAAIMLSIMERGMADDIVILPVHDGCLCPKKHTGRVLQYFEDEEIVTDVSLKHYQDLPIKQYQTVLAAVRNYRHAA